MATDILLVRENWTSSATHYNGFDLFYSTTFHLGAEAFVKALEAYGEFRVTHMKAHEAAEGFNEGYGRPWRNALGWLTAARG